MSDSKPVTREELVKYWGEGIVSEWFDALYDALPDPPASADVDACGNCHHGKDDHSSRGAERCGIPWCQCPGYLTVTPPANVEAAIRAEFGLEVERLARALGVVGHNEGLHRWCKDVDDCGLYADGWEFAATLAAEYARLTEAER